MATKDFYKSSLSTNKTYLKESIVHLYSTLYLGKVKVLILALSSLLFGKFGLNILKTIAGMTLIVTFIFVFKTYKNIAPREHMEIEPVEVV